MGKYTDCGRELENGVGSEKDNPVYKIICQSVSKKLFLLAIIAFSVAVILNLIEVFSYSISFESPFYSIFLRVGVNAEFFVDLFFQLFRIIYVVPPIVIAVSMWITYFTIKTSQSGIKILRVMMILYVAFACLAVVRSALTYLSYAALWGGFDLEAFALCSPLILAFAVCIAFMAVYYLMTFKLLGKIQTMLVTGVVTKIPRFVGLASLALGSFSVVYTLISTPSTLSLRYVQISDVLLSLAINLASALATILFGAFLLSVGEKINDLVKIQ